MADFDNVRFPPRISLNAIGGPGFKTSVSTMSNGREARRQWWEHERGEYTISHHARTPEDWQPLLAFQRVVSKGMSNTFRFKDWSDFVCANGEGFFIDGEVGSPLGKQMVKRYTFYGIDGTAYTHDRIVAKPVRGKITTDATGLDYATGIAASGTTWYGEFDVWARLNIDIARLQVIDKQGQDENGRPILLMGWDGIEIVEVVLESL
jgi:uncharacterized protein (TIGR02217 family)